MLLTVGPVSATTEKEEGHASAPRFWQANGQSGGICTIVYSRELRQAKKIFLYTVFHSGIRTVPYKWGLCAGTIPGQSEVEFTWKWRR